jgi:MraZ protein
MFKGFSAISLDTKGRLSMPTRHREVLQATASNCLTITRDPDGCILIFPRPEWDKFSERIAALPMSARWHQRVYLGSAMDVELDGTGRILISPELRAATGITKETMLIGMGSHFELWDKDIYAVNEQKGLAEGMPATLQSFSFKA